MTSGSSFQSFDLTIWSNLAHNLANLLLLGIGESIFDIFSTHSQCLELSLPCEDDKQRTQALIGTFKPILLILDGQALESVELSISECLE